MVKPGEALAGVDLHIAIGVKGPQEGDQSNQDEEQRTEPVYAYRERGSQGRNGQDRLRETLGSDGEDPKGHEEENAGDDRDGQKADGSAELPGSGGETGEDNSEEDGGDKE